MGPEWDIQTYVECKVKQPFNIKNIRNYIIVHSN
jgi:hypothetical protein